MKYIASILRFIFSVNFLIFALICVAIVCVLKIFETPIDETKNLIDKTGDPSLQQAYAETQNKKAFAATLTAYRKQYGSYDWAKEMADDIGKNIRWDALVDVAMSINNDDVRDENLIAFQILTNIGAIDVARELTETLKKLRAEGGNAWDAVQRHSIAVVVYQATKQAQRNDLWDWYVSDDNADWIDPFLRNIPVSDDADGEVSAETKPFIEALVALKDNAPLFKKYNEEIETEYSQDPEKEIASSDAYAAGISLALPYAPILRVAAKEGVPVSEALGFIFYNSEYYTYSDYDGAKKTLLSSKEKEMRGVEMKLIRETYPAVWEAGMIEPNVALIWKIANPSAANAVFSEYADWGISELLVKHYYEKNNKELLKNAVLALQKNGDYAFTILANYKDDQEFKDMLADPKFGARVVPYLLLKGSESTFGELKDDPRWIDEHLNPDGSIKEESLSAIEVVPLVGGIATAIKKLATNRPVTAGDLGWAAFDVVDIAITVATFGAGAVATTSIKTAAKTGAKVGAKASVKTGAKFGAKTSAKTLAKVGGKTGAKATSKKFYLRSSVTFVTGKITSATKIFKKGIENVHNAWKSLKPKTRMTILKGTTYAMFCYVMVKRTIPGVGKVLGELAKKAVDTLKNYATSFVKTISGTITGPIGDGASKITFIVVCIICGCLAGYLLIWRRRRRGPISI